MIYLLQHGFNFPYLEIHRVVHLTSRPTVSGVILGSPIQSGFHDTCRLLRIAQEFSGGHSMWLQASIHTRCNCRYLKNMPIHNMTVKTFDYIAWKICKMQPFDFMKEPIGCFSGGISDRHAKPYGVNQVQGLTRFTKSARIPAQSTEQPWYVIRMPGMVWEGGVRSLSISIPFIQNISHKILNLELFAIY